MYQRKLGVFAVAFTVLLSLASGLTDQEKFSGSFNFVNQTLFNSDGSTTYSFQNLPIHGGIFYASAYAGADHGNMTALWGDTYIAGDDILTHTIGYGGSYTIDAAAQTITHLPGISTVLSLIGVPQVRHYSFYDDDNLLNLRVIRSDGFLTGSLFWQRSVPLPTSTQCSVSLSVASQSEWVANDQRHERFTVTIINDGTNPLISVVLHVATIDLTVEDTSQATLVPGTTSDYVSPLYGLGAGEPYSAIQFQFAGSGAQIISLVSVQC